MPDIYKRRIRRKEDGLWLDFEFDGFELVEGPPAKLRPENQAGQVTVHVPPQHIVEATSVYTGASVDPSLIEARLSGPSRLVFLASADIPLTLDGLLNWSAWTPCLTRTAQAPTDGSRTTTWDAPSAKETAIEMPAGLVLSPGGESAWRHSRVALGGSSGSQSFELWRTTLVNVGAGDGGLGPAVRAVFAEAADSLVNVPLIAEKRRSLTRLTSMWAGGAQPEPKPVRGTLSLGMLGATTQLHGDWSGKHLDEQGDELKLNAWHHVATLGRDQYVRVVQEGYLCPTGHRACVLEIFERRRRAPVANSTQDSWSTIQWFKSVVILDRVMDYVAEKDRFPNNGREWPFSRIEIMIDSTPPEVVVSPAGHIQLPRGNNAYWGFQFPMIGWGHGASGDVSAAVFATQLTFVKDGEKGRNVWAESLFDLHDQRLSFVDDAGQPATSAALYVKQIHLKAVDAAFLRDGAAPFVPRMTRAEVRVPAIAALTGNSQVLTAAWIESYLTAGLTATKTFMSLKPYGGGETRVVFAGATGGGVAAPDFKFDALALDCGPTIGTQDPKLLLEGTVLLGTLNLSELVNWGAQREPRPKLAIENGRPAFEWELNLQSFQASFLDFDPGTDPAQPGRLLLATKQVKTGAEEGVEVHGMLTAFTLTFANIAELKFQSLEFKTTPGQKPEIQIGSLVPGLTGPLGFFSELAREVARLNLFGKHGPKIDVSAEGVVASFALALPDVPLGILSVQSIRLGTQVSLPFTGRPAAVTLSFGERHAPFLVTVSLIGGGGFLSLTSTTHGVQRVEGALEFGGNIALDLGVAKGAVSAMVGTYFSLENDKVVFSGYYRVSGAVEVLGLISVAIQVYMALSCPDIKEENEPFVIFGEASVSVSVKVVLVSRSVTLRVQRRLEGPDPTFVDTMPLDAWRTYCQAFAR